MGIIAFIILGLLAGIIAKAILPGDDPGGIIVTILIGIASLVIAGLIFSGFWEFVIGVIVAIVLVGLYGRFMGGRAATA